jgi:glycosyltransferase involved in cell wall biosynthesis
MTLISMIMPCFNRARFISSTIESALDQSHREVEVIVVDDVSTDDSWRAISSFDERIGAIRA